MQVDIEIRKQEARTQGKSFEQFLRGIGHFVPIRPDGNCLYSAILYYLRSNVMTDQQRVRDFIADEIEINQHLYEDWIALDNGNELVPGDETARNINEKVAEIRGNAYGNAVCIKAASRVFNRNFNVISWEGINSCYPEIPNLNCPTHWLAFFGVHYDVIDLSLPPELVLSQPESSVDGDAEASAENEGLFKRAGLRTFTAKGHTNARKNFHVIFFVPKSCERQTIFDSLMEVKNRGETVYYTIVYNRYERYMYTADPFVCATFVAFATAIRTPIDQKMHKVFKWPILVILPHLFMSTLKQKWNGVQIEFFTCYTRGSMATNLIYKGWKGYCHTIRQKMQLLTNNRDGLLCQNCCRNCPLSNEVWHLNLANCSKQVGSPVEGVTIFKRRIFFSSDKIPAPKWGNLSTYLYLIYHVYGTDEFETDLASIFEFIAVLVPPDSGRHNCSYLALLVDGPQMSPDVKFRDIAENELYHKSIYAGRTTNITKERFRMDHVENKRSPINALLTKTSKLYLLRSKVFENAADCYQDEAKIIEILKEVLARSIEMKRPRPFILLNCFSEVSSLLSLNSKEIEDTLDFIDSMTPIFIAGDEEFTYEDRIPDPQPEAGGKFTGNLVVRYPFLENFNVEATFEDRRDVYNDLIARNSTYRFNRAKSRFRH